MAADDCRNWEALGFATRPKLASASGADFIYRCYSSTPKTQLMIGGEHVGDIGSFLYGNCFFAPKVSRLDLIQNAIIVDRKRKWTWTYLERQLNAWFWDNDYDRIAMFQLRPAVAYWIGPVGQGTLAAAPHQDRRTGQYATHQRHLAWPGVSSELLQVVLRPGDRALRSCLHQVDDWKVPGAVTVWGRG